MNAASPARFDAVVVGAGPAGSATARALALKGWRVAVIERRPTFQRTVGDSLHAAARVALKELGLENAIPRQCYRPTELVRSSWGFGGLVREKPSIVHRFGPDLHVDRAAFDEWLLEASRSVAVEVIRPASVTHIERRRGDSRNGWRVGVKRAAGELSLDCQFLVDATGRAAWLTQKLAGRRVTLDRLIGVARWLDQTNVEPVTLVEATREGWWYSAPAPDNQLVAVWMTDAQSAAGRASDLSIWERCVALGPMTAARLTGSKAASSARVLRASPAISDWDPNAGWLPVGDAALSFDPVSGAGLCFALRSALEAAAVLDSARRGDVGAGPAYRAGARRVFAAHLLTRNRMYQQENRFADAAFWTAARGAELWGTVSSTRALPVG